VLPQALDDGAPDPAVAPGNNSQPQARAGGTGGLGFTLRQSPPTCGRSAARHLGQSVFATHGKPAERCAPPLRAKR